MKEVERGNTLLSLSSGGEGGRRGSAGSASHNRSGGIGIGHWASWVHTPCERIHAGASLCARVCNRESSTYDY